MNTQIVSLNVDNLQSEEDELRILSCFTQLEWVENVTVNVPDRNVIVSGEDASRDRVVLTMLQLGYKAC